MANLDFYFDEMMPRAPVKPLSEFGHTVVMANDVGMTGKSDEAHLAYAAGLSLITVTFDRPFAGRAAKLTDHCGLICLSGTQENIGYIVRTLNEFAGSYSLDEIKDRVFWL